METAVVVRKLKEYQIVEKLSVNSDTGYMGLGNRELWAEINQLINGEIIPTFIYLIKENRLTNKDVKQTIDNFFDYLAGRKIYHQLDTEDKEELNKVLLTILQIIGKEHIPLN